MLSRYLPYVAILWNDWLILSNKQMKMDARKSNHFFMLLNAPSETNNQSCSVSIVIGSRLSSTM